jgi:hypothetical protein
MEVTGAFGSGFDFFVFLIVTFSVSGAEPFAV